MSTIMQALKSAGTFNTFVKSLETTGLDATLSSGDAFTVFAPTDSAFDALGAEVRDVLFADTQRLTNVLKYHVLAGTYLQADIDSIRRATTLEGDDVSFHDDGLRVDESTITGTPVTASNGVIYSLTQVLLPEKYLYQPT